MLSRIVKRMGKFLNAVDECVKQWIIRRMDNIDARFKKWSEVRDKRRQNYLYKKLTVCCLKSSEWSEDNKRERLIRVEGFRDSNEIAQNWVNKYPYGSARVVDGWYYWEEYDKEKKALRKKRKLIRIAKETDRFNRLATKSKKGKRQPKRIFIRSNDKQPV